MLRRYAREFSTTPWELSYKMPGEWLDLLTGMDAYDNDMQEAEIEKAKFFAEARGNKPK